MPGVTWPLVGGRPVVEVGLVPPGGGNQETRVLLADTGAGLAHRGMDLIVGDVDGARFERGSAGIVGLGGAYAGHFPAFWVEVAVPGIGFRGLCVAVAVPVTSLPRQLQGIACFRLLNRFSYGNFGDPDRFGLEKP